MWNIGTVGLLLACHVFKAFMLWIKYLSWVSFYSAQYSAPGKHFKGVFFLCQKQFLSLLLHLNVRLSLSPWISCICFDGNKKNFWCESSLYGYRPYFINLSIAFEFQGFFFKNMGTSGTIDQTFVIKCDVMCDSIKTWISSESLVLSIFYPKIIQLPIYRKPVFLS